MSLQLTLGGGLGGRAGHAWDNRKHQERSNSFLPAKQAPGPLKGLSVVRYHTLAFCSQERPGPRRSHSILCSISPGLSVPGRLARESLASTSL